VQTDDEKSLPAEAEREVGIVRVRPNPLVIRTPAEGVDRDSRRLGLRID
jgi:hypothetical protein